MGGVVAAFGFPWKESWPAVGSQGKSGAKSDLGMSHTAALGREDRGARSLKQGQLCSSHLN